MRTNIDCSTKRAAVSSGRRTGATAHLTGLNCSPLDPADPARRGELREQFKIESPHALLEVFIRGNPDIQRGDILTVASADYPIRAVASWAKNGPQKAYVYLVVEDTSG